jgi:phosphotransferase system HPr-like phosphotransfer protein
VRIASLANSFKSTIVIKRLERLERIDPLNESVENNAKSVQGLLSTEATFGDSIALEARGSDADEAIRALAELVRSGFGEAGEMDPGKPR